MTTDAKPKLLIDLPIIDELGDGYFLVAHKKGPAIMTEFMIGTLELAVTDPPRDGEMFNDDAGSDLDIPIHIGRKAIESYSKWSWPQCSHSDSEVSTVRSEDLRALTRVCHELLNELRPTQQDKPSWLTAEKYMSQVIAVVETQVKPQ